LAAFGITPTAAIALALLFKVKTIANGFDKRLSLLEQALEYVVKNSKTN
jgi:hypothetical protein